MARPDASEWQIVGYRSDPVPGNPNVVENLAADLKNNYGTPLFQMATVLQQIQSKSVGTTTFSMSQAGVAFVEMLGDFPSRVAKLSEGVNSVESGLKTWASDMNSQQVTADRALNEAVEAYNQRKSLQSQLSSTQSQLQRSKSADTSHYSDAQKANHQSSQELAEQQIDQLTRSIAGYDADFESAKATINRAKADYDEAEARFVNAVFAAQNQAGVKKMSFLQALRQGIHDFFMSDTWKTIVKVSEFIGAVVGVLSLFIPGPGWLFAAIIMATSAISLVDSTAKYSRGEIGLLELGLNGLAAIAGGLSGAAGIKAVGEAAKATSSTVKATASAGEVVGSSSKAQVFLAKAMGFGDKIVSSSGTQIVPKGTVAHEIGNNFIKSMMPSFVKGDPIAGNLGLVFKDAFSTADDAQHTLDFVKDATSSAKEIYSAYAHKNAGASKQIAMTLNTVHLFFPGLSGFAGGLADVFSAATD